MAVQEAPHQTLDSSCPTCGARAQDGQLVCLECGSRIALAYRRPPSWKIPVAIAVLVGLLALAGAVLAYQAIGDDAKEEAASAPLKPKLEAAKADTAATAKADTRAAETSATSGSVGGLVPKGRLYTWPRDLSAFTVVLLSTEDRASAVAMANSVADSKTTKTGVIRSEDFETLPQGFYIVFGGSYETRASADRAAARLGATYQGAFTQVVRR